MGNNKLLIGITLVAVTAVAILVTNRGADVGTGRHNKPVQLATTSSVNEIGQNAQGLEESSKLAGVQDTADTELIASRYTLTLSQATQFGNEDSLRIDFDTGLDVCCDKTPYSLIKFTSPELTVYNGGAKQVAQKQLTDQLLQNVYPELDKEGKLNAIAVKEGTDPFVIGLIAKVTASIYAAPAYGQQSTKLRGSWQQEEKDVSGIVTTQYAWKDSKLSKVKKQYRQVSTDKPEDWKIKHKAVFSVDDDGLTAAEVDETTTVVNSSVNVLADYQLTLARKELKTGAVSTIPANYVRIKLPLSSNSIDGEPGGNLSHEKQMLKGADFNELYGLLSSNPNRRDRARLLSRIKALFLVDVYSVSKVLTLFESGISPDILSAYVAALAAAGHPQAQAVLREMIMSNHISEELRNNVISHLGSVEKPVQETIDLFQDLLKSEDNFKTLSVSRYSAGDAILNAEKSNSAESASLVESLLNAYQVASTNAERLKIIGALGNSGQRDMIPLVQGLLTSQDISMRAKAVRALRFVPGKDVDAMVGSVLAGDPNYEVRSNALATANTRRKTMLNQIVTTMQSDSNMEIRLAALNYVGMIVQSGSDDFSKDALRDSVELIAQSDTYQAIRDRAAEILY